MPGGRGYLLYPLFASLGISLLMFYLLVGKTSFRREQYSELIDGTAVRALSFRSPLLQSHGACRGMRAARVWPEDNRCENKSNCGQRIAMGEGYSLPQTVVEGVKYLLLFVGIGRSGSSIVGSVIDAHPNAAVANQYQLMDGYIAKPALHDTKAKIFSRLVGFSLKQARAKTKNFGKGYSLAVGNGTIRIDEATQLTVIGDKGAGMLPSLYVTDPERFVEEYRKLKKTVGVPIKFVQVIRNPFDNIATEIMYKTGRASLRVSLVEGRHPPLKLRELGQLPECTKSRYFTQMVAISHMETALNLSILRVHLVDLITDTRKTLQSMCDFLHLECTEGYLKTCEASIFKELSQTKNMVEWYPELKTSVESWIKQIPWLQRYSFSKD